MSFLKTFSVALLVVALLYVCAAGVALVPFNPLQLLSSGTPGHKPHIKVLNSFEGPAECHLRADGYIRLKQVRANASRGRYALQAEIYLETYFYPTPTPAAAVAEATAAPAKEWRPAVYYASDGVSPLRVTDWRPYDYFKMDVMLGEDRPANAYLLAADARGNTYQTPTQVLEPKKANVMAMDIADLKNEYLDVAQIRYVAFVFDIAGRGQAPIVFLDNYRLERTRE